MEKNTIYFEALITCPNSRKDLTVKPHLFPHFNNQLQTLNQLGKGI